MCVQLKAMRFDLPVDPSSSRQIAQVALAEISRGSAISVTSGLSWALEVVLRGRLAAAERLPVAAALLRAAAT